MPVAAVQVSASADELYYSLQVPACRRHHQRQYLYFCTSNSNNQLTKRTCRCRHQRGLFLVHCVGQVSRSSVVQEEFEGLEVAGLR